MQSDIRTQEKHQIQPLVIMEGFPESVTFSLQEEITAEAEAQDRAHTFSSPGGESQNITSLKCFSHGNSTNFIRIQHLDAINYLHIYQVLH